MNDLDWQKFVTEPEPGIIEFTMKPEHVALLRNAKVQWNAQGHGAPQINPDRPYGSTAFFSSIARCVEHEGDTDDTSQREEFSQLHAETAVALQVILKTGKFKATTYRADKFTQDWKEYNPNGRKPRTPKTETRE